MLYGNRKFEELVRETESLVREYHEASQLRDTILVQVGKMTMSNESFELDGFKNNLEDAEFKMRYSKERLEEVKELLNEMVNNLSLGE